MLKRLKKKTIQESDRFFSIFAGEFVKVFLKNSVEETIESEQGAISQNSPLSLTGYLLDFDERYYYLGDNPNQVYAAVAINEVILIQEVKPMDSMDLMMEGADMKKMN